MREKPVRGATLQRVKIIAHIRRNKWKAEWVEPNRGLVDFVESGQLIVPWREQRVFLKEEANEQRIEEHNERHGYKRNSPVERALEQIFESVADDVAYFNGVASGPLEAIERVMSRAGMEGGKHSMVAYTDRRGDLNLPFDEALKIGRRFCAAEPAAVLLSVETTEREWTQKALRGENCIISLLNEYRAS